MTTHPDLTPAAVLSHLRDAGPHGLSLSQLSKLFRLKGHDRAQLKHVLKTLQKMGRVQNPRDQIYRAKDQVKPSGSEPRPKKAQPRLIGIYHAHKNGRGGIVKLADKRKRFTVTIDKHNAKTAEDGDLVQVALGGRRGKDRLGQVVQIIGHRDDAGAISLIALHEQQIPTEFPEEAVALAESAELPPLGKRTDYTKTPLVTIDGADARDFDDAVHARPDTDKRNPGGYHLIVAIADVAYYVRPEDALDEEALKRGNSVYFPDRVVPMLPEALSNGLCSLMPEVKRGCLAIEMRIDKDGKLLSARVKRGIMRSAARLTYEQVQAARDGKGSKLTDPLMESVITPLYDAYEVLKAARQNRGALDLDMPERVVKVRQGQIDRIEPRVRLESHKLIEEFMIMANVAAAQLLEAKRTPAMYRVHDKPAGERLMALQNTLKEFGLKLTGKGKHHTNPKPADFAALLKRIDSHAAKPMLLELILRSQSQAVYSPFNLGHFGLALERYAHFTSPIRRYADLIVHRALIAAYGLGEGGERADSAEILAPIGEQITETERRAVQAERSAMQRYLALYMQGRVGKPFTARISGVRFAGLFLTVDESGADGFLPRRFLPQDYYRFDEKSHKLIGQRSKRSFRLGQKIEVRLVEAIPLSGELVFEMLGSSVLGEDDFDDEGPAHRRRAPAKSSFKRGGGKGSGDNRFKKKSGPKKKGSKFGGKDTKGKPRTHAKKSPKKKGYSRKGKQER